MPHPLPMAALALFALAVFGGVCGLKHLVVETSFDDYFVEGDPMLIKTDEFKSHFGNDYFIGVLTECDNHFTTESLTALRQLSNELLDSLSYIDKITSLTDIEFLVGNEEGMAIEQIVPENIPTDRVGLDSIRTKAYCKPEIARKLVSKDGRQSWIVIKLRPFPEDTVWKKTSTVAPDLITGAEVERIISKPCYSSLNPKATGMPFVNQQKMKFIGQDMKRNTLNLSTFAYVDVTNGGVYNRLAAGYAITDQIHAFIGYDLFHADAGMFAMYSKNSEIWLKLKYSF